jgi:UDP-hydrolysing UDP-N-acetyl-D-glucosamine 2-epimerase
VLSFGKENKVKKICLITGSRADYGLSYWLLKEINADKDLVLQLVVTGSHLQKEFGETVQTIIADGFPIAFQAPIDATGGDAQTVTKSFSTAVSLLSQAFVKLQPDIVIVLGDRYEMLAAAVCALIMNIPLAHIHGGELSEGVIDDAIRHSITKMSQLHFVAAEAYRNRVIQLGEDPKHVWNVGAMAVDAINNLKRLPLEELQKLLNFQWKEPLFLVTYHPTTFSPIVTNEECKSLLDALDMFPNNPVIFTAANADANGRIINQVFNQYSSLNPKRCRFYSSLGSEIYLNTLCNSHVVIGNSSSGIIEAPFLKIPAVNIGDRQRGRLKASSIIDCLADPQAIAKGIKKALSPEFRKELNNVVSLYGAGSPARAIKEKIKNIQSRDILKKHFNDLPQGKAG